MRSDPEKKPQRLKRKDLVMGVLYHFSEIFESSDAESIWDIAIPVEDLCAHLKERFGVEYSSNQWVYTQLRRYEDEIGARLFEKKARRDVNTFRVCLHREMLEFIQKQHLYVPQKIKAARGAYDKILSTPPAPQDTPTDDASRDTSVLLGAGSTVYHLASIFIDHQHSTDRTFSLHTHNAGILPMLLGQHVDHRKLSVVAAGGTLDPVTRTLLGDPGMSFTRKKFDFIVQGTSLVWGEDLFIESLQEQRIKKTILNDFEGCKILVLTKHEFQDHPMPGVEPYGKITDYDYVIVPRSIQEHPPKKHDRSFQESLGRFEPEIMNWNYCILRIRTEPGQERPGGR
ncbi:hypothetical protein [Alkalispirochaeta sphaeroplastigenens]|nr:hypothetical protein [Alkalispirochaeta sphaeroplastigenens]